MIHFDGTLGWLEIAGNPIRHEDICSSSVLSPDFSVTLRPPPWTLKAKSKFFFFFFFGKKKFFQNFVIFTESSQLGRFSHRVAMSVEMWLCAIGCSFFFEASQWPSGHMISSRPLIGPPKKEMLTPPHFF